MLSKEERIRNKNTKRIHKIIDKYDFFKNLFLYDIEKDLQKAENYLNKMMPEFEQYIENANLDRVVYKNFKRVVLNEGDDVELQYSKAQSALMWAIDNKKFDLAEKFILLGADINKRTPTSRQSEISAFNVALDKDRTMFLINKGFCFKENETDWLKLMKFYPTEQKSDNVEITKPKTKSQTKAFDKEREM